MGQNTLHGCTCRKAPGLDADGKGVLVRAAELRRISVSDYVRQVTVSQARREVVAAAGQTLALTPDEQIAVWNSLAEPLKRMSPKPLFPIRNILIVIPCF